MTRTHTLRRVLSIAVLLIASATPALRAQTVDDGIVLRGGELFAGNMFVHDRWDEYWEGTLKRDNGNIGTLTTRTNSWFGTYGVTDRLNVLVTLPYVWTRASQGVLEGMEGVQDISLSAKYLAIERSSTPLGRLRAIAVGSIGLPITNYTPDFQPLSIGSASKRVAGRFTVNLQSDPGWFVNGSAAHTWRATVTLDRPYYFTDDEFFLTDRVDMPNVFDYVASGGYLKRGVMLAFMFSQQRTLGGGDIRRQDMPFVSNRMNFSRIGGTAMHPIPKLRDLAVQASYGYTIEGRNVGQSTTYAVGVLYSRQLFRRRTP